MCKAGTLYIASSNSTPGIPTLTPKQYHSISLSLGSVSSRVDKVRELDHKKSEQSLRQGRKKQREMTKVKWRPRVCEITGLVQSKYLLQKDLGWFGHFEPSKVK